MKNQQHMNLDLTSTSSKTHEHKPKTHKHKPRKSNTRTQENQTQKNHNIVQNKINQHIYINQIIQKKK